MDLSDIVFIRKDAKTLSDTTTEVRATANKLFADYELVKVKEGLKQISKILEHIKVHKELYTEYTGEEIDNFLVSEFEYMMKVSLSDVNRRIENSKRET